MNSSVAHVNDELLSAYLDGELPEGQTATVEDHLERCAGCRAELDGLRRVTRSLGRLERAAPPPLLAGRVQRQVSLARQETGWIERLEGRLRVPRFDSPLLLMFVLVLALVTIVYLFSQGVAQRQGAEEVSIRTAAPAEVEELLRTVEGVRIEGREMVRCGAGWCEAGTEGATEGTEIAERRAAEEGAWYGVLLAEPGVEFVRYVGEGGEVVEVGRR